MYYFEFKIPTNTDGSRVTYSPGWHGTMKGCPKAVRVLLYNDKEGYGIAQTEDTFVPKEVTKITGTETKKILDSVKDEDGVWFGEKLANRWNPEVLIEEVVPDTVDEVLESVTRKAVFCPICHQFIMWLPDTLVAKTIQLTCPIGHKVVLNGG